MKKYISVFLSMMLVLSYAIAQDAADPKPYFDEAKSQYAAGNLDDARFALEQALTELDELVATKILEITPTQIGDLQAIAENDQYSGTSIGLTGLYVFRSYENPSDPEQSMEMSIMTNSPLLASVTNFLSNSILGGIASSAMGQKRIKVDGYKAMLQQDENAEKERYTINIPFSESLITLEFSGMDENTVLTNSNQIPVSQIVKIAQ
ncbi:MAG: hypothetical protein AAF388_21740 [Bacteroidota bacterium]